jgi:hypothetical protein
MKECNLHNTFKNLMLDCKSVLIKQKSHVSLKIKYSLPLRV